MPVKKYRSVAEMPDAEWLEPDDPRLVASIALCWQLAARLSPIRFPRGVHKHRSIVDLNRQTDRWEAEAARGG